MTDTSSFDNHVVAISFLSAYRPFMREKESEPRTKKSSGSLGHDRLGVQCFSGSDCGTLRKS